MRIPPLKQINQIPRKSLFNDPRTIKNVQEAPNESVSVDRLDENFFP
jgi:hypothetical protein